MRRGLHFVVACLGFFSLVSELADVTSASEVTARGPLGRFLGTGVRFLAPPDHAANLQDSRARPVSLAAADLDRDGFSDVVAGYATPGGGIVAVLRGVEGGFAPTAELHPPRRAAAARSPAASAGGVGGPHGFRSDGTPSPSTGVGQCGVMAHEASATCP